MAAEADGCCCTLLGKMVFYHHTIVTQNVANLFLSLLLHRADMSDPFLSVHHGA